jgi:hypothetical protein
MMVSRVPGRIERRRVGMLAIIDSIIQDHRDRRAADDVDEDEDLLDVLLRLQEDMGSQDPLTTANIKSVIAISRLHNLGIHGSQVEIRASICFFHRTCSVRAATRRR